MLDPSVNRKDLQQDLLRGMALTFRNKLLNLNKNIVVAEKY